MKKLSRVLAVALVAAIIVFGGLAACGPETEPHVCEHPCPVCGLCTDPDCDDPVCAEKCPGHETAHECEQKCPVCGGCLDMECKEEECAVKCGSDHANKTEYSVTGLKVAKSGVTLDVTGGFATDFNLANGGAISYKFDVAEEMTATMSVFVRRTVSSRVYTDYVDVTVNGEKFASPATVPALSNSATATWSEVNLGCVELKAGANEISFVAKGNGADCWAFKSLKLYYDTIRTEQQLATEVAHECMSACATCGGCTDFSCYNPGCANKCTCVNGSHAATKLYWALDPKVVSNRSANSELDGIGSTWNQTTTITYEIVAEKAGTVGFGAVISTDTFDVLFTDQFSVTVNGVKVRPGTGMCPKTESREWNTYRLVDAGYLDLAEGKNTISISQKPVREENGGNGAVYNFQAFAVFSDDVATEWYEHVCTNRCPVCDHCTDASCTESACSAKCKGHVNADVDFTGYDVTVSADKNYKCQIEDFYNFDKFVTASGEDMFVYDDTGKAFNGDALVAGSRLVIRFKVKDNAAIALRPLMTPVVIPEDEEDYSIDGVFTFIVDGKEFTEYRLQKADKGGWTVGNQYVNVTAGVFNFSPGDHTFEIVVNKTGAPHINEVRLNVQAYGEWQAAETPATHVCSQVCPECGGCKNVNCADPACEKKCTCSAHALVPIPAKAATCSEDGNAECYYCADCGKYFADPDAATELDYATQVVIPADPSLHVETTNGRNDPSVTCSACGKLFGYRFAVNDDRMTRSRTIDGATQAIGAKWNEETSFSFEFVAEKAGTVTLYVTLSEDTKELVFTEKIATVLNGEKLSLPGRIAAYPEREESSFHTVEVGQVTLKEGLNTISFAYTPVKVNKGGDGIFYNILNVSFSPETALGWTTHVCESMCEVCGGCKDAACTDPVCENKCGCSNPFLFYAVDDETTISGSTKKNKNENCVGMQSGKSASLTYTLNVSEAGTVRLYVCLTGNTVANPFSSIYTVKINGTEISTDAVIHTAADKWIDYKPVYIGEYELQAGENTIEISWTAGTSGEYYYNLRSIGIDAAEGVEVAYKPAEGEQ